ncbi:MAG: sigma-70 family RNA polymerase sigma factor [Sandaracinaceae bacterium]
MSARAAATALDELGVPGWRERVESESSLDVETERALLVAAREGDRQARERLVCSQLPMVLHYALKLRRYGVPIAELASEGTLGLLEAVDRFDLSREVRFSTYASTWVRNFVLERVAAHRSPLGSAKGAFRTRYWFRLRRELARETAAGTPREVATGRLAERLGISRRLVTEMMDHLGFRAASPPEGGGEWEVESPTPTPLDELEAARRRRRVAEAVERALSTLSERERALVRERMMSDDPPSLAALGRLQGVSRERMRQIEVRARERLRIALRDFRPT